MQNKKLYKAYQKQNQYGAFGSGDHAAEGGKVVKGLTGPIHIKGGIESDIMKTHGAEGESILAQRKGYRSLEEAPINQETGYAQYGFGDLFSGKAWNKDWWYGSSSIGDKASDWLQQKMGIGEYGEEFQKNKQLQEMLDSQFTQLLEGTQKMIGEEGFITQGLQEQLGQLTSQSEILERQGETLKGGEIDIQRGVEGQMGKIRSAGAKTGLVSSYNTQQGIEDVERAGIRGMPQIGTGMQDIASRQDILSSKMRQAETQAGVEEYKTIQDTQGAMAQMITSYMNATGESIPGEFMSLYEDYIETYG